MNSFGCERKHQSQREKRIKRFFSKVKIYLLFVVLQLRLISCRNPGCEGGYIFSWSHNTTEKKDLTV